MILDGFSVEVRQKDLERLGVILPEDLLSLKVAVAFNATGSWTLILDSSHPLAGPLATPGAGIIVSDKHGELMSGPMTKVSYTADDDNPAGLTTFTGITDDYLLADRECLPSPLNPATSQAAHDVRTGAVEDVMHAFVSANVGPTASSTRREPRLVMGPNSHLGPTITKAARFDVLGALLEDVALAGNLGFRVIQRKVGGVERFVFETYAQNDVSDFVRLSLWNNTVRKQTVSIAAPTATDVIIAGQGELEERTFYAGTDALATAAGELWGRRIERFVDMRQTDDTSQYVQRVSDILSKEGRTNVAVQIIPVDDDATMTYGEDYHIGDIVGADTEFGEYDALVSGFILAAKSDGLQFGVLVGDNPMPTDIKRLNDLVARLSKIERGQ